MATVDRSGVTIHYEVEGTGPPLVLHTGGGGDLEMWRLAGYPQGLAGRQLILIDHRGHGRSDRPRDLAQHRIDEYVDDVVAVADAAGAERFGFFGYSAGATIGYRLAARHADRVDALIGLGTMGAQSDWRRDDDGDAAFAEQIRREGSDALVRLLRDQEPDVPDWFAGQMRDTDPEMFALQIEGRGSWPGPWAEFASIAAPALIIVGQTEEGDDHSAEAHAREAAATMRDARVAVVPELGHVMAFVRSDLVLPPVREFLAEVSPVSGGPEAR
jgi:pimeloyl-ACP methyl ester carboxylesterase